MKTIKIIQKLHYKTLCVFVILLLIVACKDSAKNKQENKNTFLTKDFKIIDSAFINIPSEGSISKTYENREGKKIITISSIGTLKKAYYEILIDSNNEVFFTEKEETYNIPIYMENSKLKNINFHEIKIKKNEIYSWHLNKGFIKDTLEYKNKYIAIKKVLNSTLHNHSNNSKWIGGFNLYKDLGEIDGIGINVGYHIKIKKDSILFSGQGYQTNFRDLCYSKQNTDTLELYYNKTLEGTDYNKNEKGAIAKLYKKKDAIFIISPVIEDGEIQKDIPVIIQKER
jgi:hypothetical protein